MDPISGITVAIVAGGAAYLGRKLFRRGRSTGSSTSSYGYSAYEYPTSPGAGCKYCGGSGRAWDNAGGYMECRH
ncbi:hypothetical protein Dvina_47375 [Dactylosporangium vinaceum]|uniref:Uncharacterized protein n=1 Tax=Dactylosporangium vinaceum TaxID=53362 RepID=A0ABV5M5G1_9ACTN|nr:hypothetical protein [Dactylosporangium vinaceum]UAB95551.1 hypothetical protein Dvina_47375 [Dactylosporangium vinaceum]